MGGGGGGGGYENDLTFDYTLYTGADPESTNAKAFKLGNRRK